EYDGVKGCTKSESNGTEGEEGKPMNQKYDMARKSYKNYPEVDGTCRVWMMKVENIRGVKSVGNRRNAKTEMEFSI
ncbi:17798_t:CDS:2, partial [Gigaspora rosea]